MRAVDITYSLYFGSCIYLGKQGTPITSTRGKKSPKKHTTTATVTHNGQRENVKHISIFHFLFGFQFKRNENKTNHLKKRKKINTEDAPKRRN